MFLNRKRTSKRRTNRGATTIEFAIIAPIVILFSLALLEWGRFEMVRQASSSAAFNATRKGTLPGATEADTEQAAQDILKTYFITGSTVTTTFDEDSTTVLVSVPVGPNSFLLSRLFGDRVVERDFTLFVR